VSPYAKIRNHNRVSSIDTLRVFAILAIIVIHTRPFFEINQILYWIINQGARYAVPFFFVAAGYLFFQRIVSNTSDWKRLLGYQRRLWSIFIGWNILYLLKPNFSAMQVGAYMEGYVQGIRTTLDTAPAKPILWLLEGIESHLWFIPALSIGLMIVATLDFMRYRFLIFPIAFGLYLAGLLAESYSPLIAMDVLPISGRDGPFFSTVFVAIGWFLSRWNNSLSLKISVSIIITGFGVQAGEVYILYNIWEVAPDRHDFLLGTLGLGLGFMLLALASPQLGKQTMFPSIGVFILGVYAGHWLIIESPFNWSLKPFFSPEIWQIIFPLIVFLVTLFLAYCFSLSRLTRWLVR